MTLRILFLWQIAWLFPFCSSRADSRYYLGVIGKPFLSYIFRLKSLKTQKSEGNEFSVYSYFSNSLPTSIIIEKLFRVCSSIVPRLLYRTTEDRSKLRIKNLQSRSSLPSNEPKPSESRSKVFIPWTCNN